MEISLIIALVAVLINIPVALIVLARGLHRRLHLVFFILVLAISIWSLLNGFSNSTNSVYAAELLSRLGYGLTVVIVYLAYVVSVLMGVRSRRSVRLRVVVASLLTALIAPISSTGLVYSSDSLVSFEYGDFVPVYFVSIVIGFVGLIVELVNTLRKGDHSNRQQAKLVLGGIFTTMILVSLVGLVVPSVTGSEESTIYSPIFLIIFVLFVGSAILKYKLFSVRAVVARAVAYLVVSLLVVITFVLFAFLLKRTLIPGLQTSVSQLISNIVISVGLVVSYPLIKRKLDSLTNRFFFRDVYDPQTLIDDLNQIIVSNVDLEILLIKVSQTINQYIKTTYCMFYIRPTAYVGARIIGEGRDEYDVDVMTKLHDMTSSSKNKVIDVDDYSQGNDEEELIGFLKKNDIDLMARLVNNIELDVKGLGFIFLGAKRSGSPFDKQDLKIFEIIANELVIAVENVLRYEEIDKFNVTLQQKIDDATKELKRTNEKLVALDEAKDEFVSMASHQLRTPLTSIKGYVSMVAEEDMGKLNTQQKKMLGQALFSSQRMVYLISDLLNVSRLRTGKFVIEPKPVHLPTVIESELSQLREGASAKEITLSYHGPKEFPILYLDEMKIRQVIMNFTDNAIYYTPNGGTITLSLKETPQSVEFTVKDTGIGVPKNERHKLFTKFYRANNAKQARPDGTGLGLFMAKKVIIAQGGSVVFESVEGKGSTFGFNFPKNAVKVPDNVEVDKKKVMTSVGSEAMPEPSLED